MSRGDPPDKSKDTGPPFGCYVCGRLANLDETQRHRATCRLHPGEIIKPGQDGVARVVDVPDPQVRVEYNDPTM